MSSIDEKHSIDSKVEHQGDEFVPIMTCPSRVYEGAEEAKLYRKLDIRLLPILSLLYLLSFLDRGNVGNARLYGLEADLRMTGLMYNAALSVYFATYCLFEVPANLMLKKLSPSIWLASITIAWGIVMVGMGFVQSYEGLLICRIMLGVTEAGLFPGVILYLTQWYPKHMVQLRTAIFFCAATLAGAFSGLLAFAIGKMGGLGGYSAWRYIFIIEGAATVVAGVGAYWAIVDTPDSCKSLTPEEAAWVKWRKFSDAGAYGEAEEVSWRYILNAITNWQVFLATGFYASIVIPLYSIGLSLPTIIKTFSTFSAPEVQLLTIPIYVFACIFVLVSAYWSDKIKSRYYFQLTNQIMCFFGFTINVCNSPYGLKYFGLMIAAAGAYSGVPTSISWVGNNLQGQTKRGVGIAFVIGIGNLGALVSSNVYRTVDAPRFIIGHSTILGAVGIGMICAPTYAFLLKRENAKRIAEAARQESLPEEQRTKYTIAELRSMGDLAPTFRYTI